MCSFLAWSVLARIQFGECHVSGCVCNFQCSVSAIQIRVVLVDQNSDLVTVSSLSLWDLSLVVSHYHIPRLAVQDF